MGAISAVSLSRVPPIPNRLPNNSDNPRYLPSFLRNPKSPTLKFVAFAGEQNPNGGKIREESGGGERRAAGLNIRWRDVLDPDPENIVAVGLAGLLAWASVNVLWQLFFISIAILLAALKYSFIAAFLLFILITLL